MRNHIELQERLPWYDGFEPYIFGVIMLLVWIAGIWAAKAYGLVLLANILIGIGALTLIISILIAIVLKFIASLLTRCEEENEEVLR